MRASIDFVRIDLAVLLCDVHSIGSPGKLTTLRADGHQMALRKAKPNNVVQMNLSGVYMAKQLIIYLTKEVEKAWRSYVVSQNAIQLKLIATNGGNPILTRLSLIKSLDGRAINALILSEKLFAIRHRLARVLRSLKFVSRTVWGKDLNGSPSIEAGQRTVTGALMFNIDVIFMFTSSALDMAAGVANVSFGLGLKGMDASFKNTVQSMSKDTRFVGSPTVKALRKQKDGWIARFGEYRNYLVHEGLITMYSTAKFSRGRVRIGAGLLPDNPWVDHRTFQDKRILYPHCLEIHEKSLIAISEMLDLVGKVLR
jgi:hypothetical protein